MKANRKFISADEEAVSPVIAVILMVAITVVLAATVYVWVSGFGSSSSTASKTISLSSAGALVDSTNDYKVYTISAATPGMKYSDIKFTLDGAALPCDADGTYAADGWHLNSGVACTATDGSGPDQTVSAGDRVTIYDVGGTLSGKTLRILDSNANSVILTLNIG